jgi:DNA-binding NtrC family response regulator
VSPDALALLRSYSWPGNLRELENIIERAVVLASSQVIDAEHLPLHVQHVGAGKAELGFRPTKSRAIEQFERQALSSYLLQADGNISRAASLAKIPRRSFHRLIAKYKLMAKASKA